ncbi:uncharacterized protein LOC117326413 [Pecten maximus]|uniref:uncharacterized protein LOC117326413 n=1 Tax=Pecten maximus TaxID=6579 RepID=UPI00145907AA|nr:uncharacterized protein LOC117326413 [Pecten maximus]
MAGGTIALITLLLSLSQSELSLVNLSLRRQTASSDFREGRGPSSLVVDGNNSDKLNDPNNSSIPQCLYTIKDQKTAFWQVDLDQTVVLDHVKVISRRGGSGQLTHQRRRNGYSILVSRSSTYLPMTPNNTCYSDTDPSLSVRNNETQWCSNIGSYVTIYNQRNTLSGRTYSRNAVLELCEVMVMGCPIHKHGDNCMENCPQNCYENMCFPRNGTCMKGCLPGYKGSTCQEECPDYYYGARCASVCNCKEWPCDVRFGMCPPGGCEPGYKGLECSKGRFQGK